MADPSGVAVAVTEDDGELDLAPIARIEVRSGTQLVSRGTGTLVAPRLVLSALHVVANRRIDPPQPYPGELTLDFPDFTTTGAILAGAWDRATDWVLIECSEAPPATPMRLAALKESKRDWQSFGFADANARDGLLLTGTVMQCDGKLEGTRAHRVDARICARRFWPRQIAGVARSARPLRQCARDRQR